MRCNLHNVLAYEQPKTVIIRDFRLGLTYYMMCALIIAYVVVEIVEVHRELELEGANEG